MTSESHPTPSRETAEIAGRWQPIETAPASGEILLYWRNAGVCVGHFSVDDHFDQRPTGWQCPEAGWRGEADELIPRNQDDCTHWMPLPAPPTIARATGDQQS